MGAMLNQCAGFVCAGKCACRLITGGFGVRYPQDLWLPDILYSVGSSVGVYKLIVRLQAYIVFAIYRIVLEANIAMPRQIS